MYRSKCCYIFILTLVLFQNGLVRSCSFKSLLLFSYSLYTLSCVIIYFLNDVFYILPFCSSFGLLMTTLTTLPYEILSAYHQDPTYIRQTSIGQRRGIGKDCSLLSSCYFLAQVIISSFISLLIAMFGQRVVLICGILSSSFSMYLLTFCVKYPS
jgi:hypothetical protein